MPVVDPSMKEQLLPVEKDAVCFVEDRGRVWRGAGAIYRFYYSHGHFRLLWLLCGRWRWFASMSEWFYGIIARNRYRWSGKRRRQD